MPIYKYICQEETDRSKEHRDIEYPQCLHEFEVLYQNQAAVEREEPDECCPKCGGTDKDRVVVNTGTSHILKGRGWAKDGYR